MKTVFQSFYYHMWNVETSIVDDLKSGKILMNEVVESIGADQADDFKEFTDYQRAVEYFNDRHTTITECDNKEWCSISWHELYETVLDDKDEVITFQLLALSA